MFFDILSYIIKIMKNSNIEIIFLNTNAQQVKGWLAIENGVTVGHVFLKEELDGNIKLMDAWVSETHRKQGIYKELFKRRLDYVNENYKGKKVFVWCYDNSLPVALSNGFKPVKICTYLEKIIE